MREIIIFVISVWIGYLFFLYFSHPLKKKHKVPHISLGNIEFLPNLRIHYKNKTYHIHHWLTLSVIAFFTLVSSESIQHFMLFKGAVLGGIIQGLRYPDRFQFRHPRQIKKHLRHSPHF